MSSWKPMALPPPRKPMLSPSKSFSQLNGSSTADQNGKKKANIEIVVLDSDEDDDDDDDDEGRVKRELSPSFGSGSSAIINRPIEGASLPVITHGSQSDIIDLTLDSDDDDELAPLQLLPRAMEKRKVPDNSSSSPTAHTWKKARIEPSVPLTATRNVNGSVNGASGSGSSHSDDTNSANPLNALRMLHFDPLRDVQRAQSSAFPSRAPAPVPRPPSILRPPVVPAPPTYRTYRPPVFGSNSPPPPPPNAYQRTGSGSMLPRVGDFSSGSTSRWP